MPDIVTISASPINVPAVLIANVLGALLMATVHFTKRKKTWSCQPDTKLFYWMCRICFLQCVLETAMYLADGQPIQPSGLLFRVGNIVIYLLSSCLALAWVCYADYKLHRDEKKLRHNAARFAVPLAVLCALIIANLFADIFFVITEDNVYRRLPPFYLYSAVIYGYLTYGTVLLHRARKKMRKSPSIPALTFLIPVFLGTLLQLCFYGLSLMWVSVAVSLTIIYINMQIEEAFIDPLTGLYNRGYQAHYARRTRKDAQITGILVDINDFKHINDTYGHVEGDRVLRQMSDILRTIRDDAVALRYGGDEFVVLLEDASDEDVAALRSTLDQRLRQLNQSTGHAVSVSIGTAKCASEDLDSLFLEMDQNLYEQKRKFHQSPAGGVNVESTGS